MLVRVAVVAFLAQGFEFFIPRTNANPTEKQSIVSTAVTEAANLITTVSSPPDVIAPHIENVKYEGPNILSGFKNVTELISSTKDEILSVPWTIKLNEEEWMAVLRLSILIGCTIYFITRRSLLKTTVETVKGYVSLPTKHNMLLCFDCSYRGLFTSVDQKVIIVVPIVFPAKHANQTLVWEMPRSSFTLRIWKEELRTIELTEHVVIKGRDEKGVETFNQLVMIRHNTKTIQWIGGQAPVCMKKEFHAPVTVSLITDPRLILGLNRDETTM